MSASGEWTYSFHTLPSQFSAAFLPLIISLAVAAGLILSASGTLRIPAAALGIVLVLATILRARRIGVWASATQVVVQNFIRTYEFNWADVSEVRAAWLGQYRGWAFKMRDGRTVSAQCLPLRGVYGETHRLAASSASGVRISAGGSQPSDA